MHQALPPIPYESSPLGVPHNIRQCVILLINFPLIIIFSGVYECAICCLRGVSYGNQ